MSHTVAFILAAAVLNQQPSRVAIVALTDSAGTRLHIAYPAGTSHDQIREDFRRLQEASGWPVQLVGVSDEREGPVATVAFLAPPQSPPTIWPLVLALQRYDLITIAYVGPCAVSQGQFENRYVTVQWNGDGASMVYNIRLKRHDAPSVIALMAPEVRRSAPSRGASALPWLILAVLVLSAAAGAGAYFAAAKFLVAPAGAGEGGRT